jgi:hypothetical protein
VGGRISLSHHLEDVDMRRRVAIAVVAIAILAVAAVTNPTEQAFYLWFAAHGELPMTPMAGGGGSERAFLGAQYSVENSNLIVVSVFRVRSSGVTKIYLGVLGTFLAAP